MTTLQQQWTLAVYVCPGVIHLNQAYVLLRGEKVCFKKINFHSLPEDAFSGDNRQLLKLIKSRNCTRMSLFPVGLGVWELKLFFMLKSSVSEDFLKKELLTFLKKDPFEPCHP